MDGLLTTNSSVVRVWPATILSVIALCNTFFRHSCADCKQGMASSCCKESGHGAYMINNLLTVVAALQEETRFTGLSMLMQTFKRTGASFSQGFHGGSLETSVHLQ